VLCGGLGTRLREETELRPKPMVPVGSRPILWHIMRSYAHHGFRKFILCLGYKAEVIKSYFLNYASMNSDFTVELKTNGVAVHSSTTTRTAGDARRYGRADHDRRRSPALRRGTSATHPLPVTYGDGLTDANLAEELVFHQEEDRIGTVLGVTLRRASASSRWRASRGR